MLIWWQGPAVAACWALGVLSGHCLLNWRARRRARRALVPPPAIQRLCAELGRTTVAHYWGQIDEAEYTWRQQLLCDALLAAGFRPEIKLKEEGGEVTVQIFLDPLR